MKNFRSGVQLVDAADDDKQLHLIGIQNSTLDAIGLLAATLTPFRDFFFYACIFFASAISMRFEDWCKAKCYFAALNTNLVSHRRC